MYDSPAVADSFYPEATVDRLTTLLCDVRQATDRLAQRTTRQRSHALKTMGDAILSEHDRILEANTLDLEISREMAVPEQVTDWLKLTPERIHRAARILHRLGDLGNPFDLWAERRRPVGVVALVYESFPELGVLAAGLCLRTCNGLLLKGSNEASQTNQVLVDVLSAALATTDLPTGMLQLVPSTWSDVTRSILVRQPELDLVIPHGRPKLIGQVVSQAEAPVVPTY
ncbi:MAG: aldehyde dehydrogenase family protein, partial [Cyanobacteria bacterium J06632_22]